MCAMSVASATKPDVSKTKDEKPSLGMSHIAEVSFTHIDQFADLVPAVDVANMSYALIEKVYPTLGKHKSFEPADVSIWTSRYQSRAERSPHTL